MYDPNVTPLFFVLSTGKGQLNFSRKGLEKKEWIERDSPEAISFGGNRFERDDVSTSFERENGAEACERRQRAKKIENWPVS